MSGGEWDIAPLGSKKKKKKKAKRLHQIFFT